MERVRRFLGLFLLGLGVSVILRYWLEQQEDLSQPLPAPAPQPEIPIMISQKMLDAAEQADDLVKINGIGPKYAEALRAIGITTYTALAAASATDLLERLQGLRGLSREKIENWIEQAKGF